MRKRLIDFYDMKIAGYEHDADHGEMDEGGDGSGVALEIAQVLCSKDAREMPAFRAVGHDF
jgi:hypothetical protein